MKKNDKKSNKKIRKRDFDSLNRSPKCMEDKLYLSDTTINKYLKSPLFKNSFGESSYHEKCKEEENIEKKKEKQ